MPEYIWVFVRAWTATADTPASSMRLANSTQLMEPLSQPRRNFTLTGFPAAPRTTAAAARAALSGSRIRAQPSPELATLGTGQPMLMSMISAPDRSSARAAPFSRKGSSQPKICTAAGRSPSPNFSREGVFLSP